MTLLLRNNFSTGPDGTNITTANSGTGDDDPWIAVGHSGASGWKVEYDLSPDRPTAEYVGLFETTSVSSTAVVAWGTAGFAQIYLRMYTYFSVAPNNPVSSPIFYAETGTGSQAMLIGVNSAGANEVFAESTAPIKNVITTGGITAGRWFRVEARIKFGVSTGEIDLYWYDEPDSDTPTEVLSDTGWSMGAATALNFYFGYVFAQANLEPLRLSGLEINDTGLPGPLPFRQKAMPGYQPTPIAVHNDVF